MHKSTLLQSGGGGSGTVTEIDTGAGLTGGPITAAGTVSLDLTHVNVWTGQQNFGAVALTSTGGHIAWNLNTAQVAKHTATENTTLDNPTNMVDGGTYIFRYTQNASSAKTLAFGSAYKWPSGNTPLVTPTLSAVDIFTFVSDGTNMYGVVQQAFS